MSKDRLYISERFDPDDWYHHIVKFALKDNVARCLLCGEDIQSDKVSLGPRVVDHSVVVHDGWGTHILEVDELPIINVPWATMAYNAEDKAYYLLCYSSQFASISHWNHEFAHIHETSPENIMKIWKEHLQNDHKEV